MSDERSVRMTERTTLETKGLDYHSQSGREMIADRAKKLVTRGEDADVARRLAVSELDRLAAAP